MSLGNIWNCWFLFRRGKKASHDIDAFEYTLETNLSGLQADIADGSYRHGGYWIFTVTENKRREIAVASVRDRVVHRLLYEYLVPIYDKTFIFDVWSCRKGKGLVGAIERTQDIFSRYPEAFVWRADIKKFFDSVDHDVLKRILSLRITDPAALRLLRQVIDSYGIADCEDGFDARRNGIPIGNLTSQIFANIYLNEADRFVKHELCPAAYLRYGDDFFIIAGSWAEARAFRSRIIAFLRSELRLEINPKHDILIPVRRGLRFLGVEIFPGGRRLNMRNRVRIGRKLSLKNVSSYRGLLRRHESVKRIRRFDWVFLERHDEDS